MNRYLLDDFPNLSAIYKLAEVVYDCEDCFLLQRGHLNIEIEEKEYRYINIPAFLYTDSEELEVRHPRNSFQSGSIRDDFDFGELILLDKKSFLNAVKTIKAFFCSEEAKRKNIKEEDIKHAGFYMFWLTLLANNQKIEYIPKIGYSIKTSKNNSLTGISKPESNFNYVDPHNKDIQKEMELVFTWYLEMIGAKIIPENLKSLDFSKIEKKSFDCSESKFFIEASVIIPVFNREKTIENALASAVNQKTTFPYNIIVIDNYSTDKTGEIIERMARMSQRDNEKNTTGNNQVNIIHIIPRRKDLGIGGCWNEGVHSEQCGRFSVQLDSDDMYSGPNTLQKIVDKFYKDQCAMVIGSYKITDYNQKELPPGIIDHREWSDDNGMNNALRINGLGAPRAFYTPLIREIDFPNVSYGEDYAMALRLSREYKIGRIYDVLYYCRRWSGNSDANLTQEQVNKNNYYKDSLRTREIEARQKINGKTNY
ncbi:MAG: glycosyltransferase family 2 protein [Bacteroidales bacterium]